MRNTFERTSGDGNAQCRFDYTEQVNNNNH